MGRTNGAADGHMPLAWHGSTGPVRPRVSSYRSALWVLYAGAGPGMQSGTCILPCKPCSLLFVSARLSAIQSAHPFHRCLEAYHKAGLRLP